MTPEIPYWFVRIVRVAVAILVIKLLLVAAAKFFRPEIKRSSV